MHLNQTVTESGFSTMLQQDTSEIDASYSGTEGVMLNSSDMKMKVVNGSNILLEMSMMGLFSNP